MNSATLTDKQKTHSSAIGIETGTCILNMCAFNQSIYIGNAMRFLCAHFQFGPFIESVFTLLEFILDNALTNVPMKWPSKTTTNNPITNHLVESKFRKF